MKRKRKDIEIQYKDGKPVARLTGGRASKVIPSEKTYNRKKKTIDNTDDDIVYF